MPHAVKDQRHTGWFWIDNTVIDIHGATLKPIALAVYMDLVRHANANGEAWPGKRTIAREIGASERAVQYALQQLKDAQLIDITERRSDAGDPTSNLYTLKDPTSLSESSLISESSLNVSGARGAPPPQQEVPQVGQEVPQVEQEVPQVGQEVPQVGQEVPHPPTEKWQHACERIKSVIARDIYNALFPRTRAELWTDTMIVIRAANNNDRDLLAKRLHRRIADAATIVAGRPIAIQILGPDDPLPEDADA